MRRRGFETTSNPWNQAELIVTPAVLPPGRVNSSVKTNLNVYDCYVMLDHRNAGLSWKSARQSGISWLID